MKVAKVESMTQEGRGFICGWGGGASFDNIW